MEAPKIAFICNINRKLMRGAKNLRVPTALFSHVNLPNN